MRLKRRVFVISSIHHTSSNRSKHIIYLPREIYNKFKFIFEDHRVFEEVTAYLYNNYPTYISHRGNDIGNWYLSKDANALIYENGCGSTYAISMDPGTYIYMSSSDYQDKYGVYSSFSSKPIGQYYRWRDRF